MWSNIQENSLARAARSLIILNEQKGCYYHNWQHVLSMYKYLEDTNEPYDEALDWAVLFHDIVYDEKPEKEKRSALMLSKMAIFGQHDNWKLSVDELGRAQGLIMRTASHLTTGEHILAGSSAIIRADLHALTNPVQTFRNFSLIMDEAIALYGISESKFAENNEKFMVNLNARMEQNKTVDIEHHVFYSKVQDGIISTVGLSRILRGLI